MKRKFLSLLLALCLLVGLMPTTAFATETAVASVTINGTTTEYDDFQNAIDAAEVGGTSVSPAVLKLLADIPYTEIDNPDYEQDSFMPAKIPATWKFGGVDDSTKYVNLDMNGHSVSNKVELWGTVMTISGNGTFNGTASQNSINGCLDLRPLSKVTIENGTFNNAVTMSTDSETLTELTINGGTFSNGAYYSTIGVFGTVIINGGNFNADNTRIFGLSKGSLTLAGGKFTCSTGVNLVNVTDNFNDHPSLSLSGGTYTNGITVNVASSDGTISYKLKDILAENKGYFDADDNQINSGLDGYTISSPVSVKEKEKVYPYVDAHGVAQTPVAATVLSGTINENIGVSGQETWYIVTESATIAQYKKFVGTVNLILADGATLTSKMAGTSGPDDTLIIWGQENGTGTFNATAEAWEAGIQLAGGTLVINGGVVNAVGCTGPDGASNGAIGENFKSITINGGTVNATATKGPAIGSNSNSPIIITGGNIILNSPISGIQTGNSGSVTVTGGTIANKNGGKVVIKSGVVSVDEDCFTNGVDITGHVHSWSSDWSSNDTHHWHECNADACPVTENSDKDSYGEHNYNQEIVSDTYKVSDADCTNSAVYYKSCVCGAVGTETFTSDSAAGHTYGTPTYTWSVDNGTCTAERVCSTDSSHKETETANSTASVTQNKTCTLPELTTYTATFTNDAFTAQKKENVQTAEATGHTYGTDWKSDSANHWHECSCGDKTGIAAHDYDDEQDTTCNTCGYVRTVTPPSSIEYDTLDGANQEVVQGDSATFRSEADFSKFVEVRMDGTVVAPENYIAEEGSTRITLKKEFIDTLSVGAHTLSIVSTDGTATATFIVKAKTVVPNDTTESNPNTGADVPQTGDNGNMGLWIGLMLASVVALVGIVLFGKKRQTR